jgi:ABC-2 type transport system permease protein
VNARRLAAVARKEFIHILRDPRSLGMAIAIPMLLLVLFGSALTLDVDEVPLVVWDQSQSQSSRDFVSRFAGSRFFRLRQYVYDYREVERAIDSREALLAVVIPTDFARRAGARPAGAGRPAAVQVIADGSDSNTATIALGYAEVVAQGYSQDVALSEVRRLSGVTPVLPLELRPRVWFNADLESKNYIIPGLIAVIMMMIAALLTSLTVAREWERGTMEQLISTPLGTEELILGKLLPYFFLGFLDMLLAVLMGQFLFHVPLRGSVALLFGLAAIFLAGALALGMVVSIVTKSQLVANQVAMVLTFLPSFLLSGFMFAISNMPRPIRLVTYLVPARYFVALLKGIYLKGVGLKILGGEAALLVLFAAVVLAVAKATFKKRLV